MIGPGRIGILELPFALIGRGAAVPYTGSGDNLFQLVDVRDLARASLQAAGVWAIGNLFILGRTDMEVCERALR